MGNGLHQRLSKSERKFIAQEIDSLVPTHSPFGLPVHVLRSRGLH